MVKQKSAFTRLKYSISVSLVIIINLVCLLVGMLLKMGGVVAWSIFIMGVICAFFFWVKLRKDTHEIPAYMKVLQLVIAVLAGLSLYSNLSWFLWILGIPINIGTVVSGHMLENYWLGPATLAYTALCYYFYQSVKKRLYD